MAGLLERLVNGGLCHGCGGCAAALGAERICITMNPAGYLRPEAVTPLTLGEETQLRQICSGATIEQTTAPNAAYDPLWGPLISVGVGHSIDPLIRYRGSSGGVITAVLTHLLETHQIDFVLQTGANPLDPVSNITKISGNAAEILAASGSRYAPSSPLEGLEAHLTAGRRFAFVGKPCDIATLRRMARHDQRIDALIPVKISFFCAGVPSRKGAIEVLDALGVTEEELAEFTYRGRGWPGLARAVRHDGSEASMDYNSSWGNILNRHLQFRCKICPDGSGEFADIVCADAWHGKGGYPDFTERDGRSLIIARSMMGKLVLDSMIAAGKLSFDSIEPEEIGRMQPYQVERKSGMLARLMAMRLRGFTAPKYTGLQLTRLAASAGVKLLARTLLGTYRRLKWKKILE